MMRRMSKLGAVPSARCLSMLGPASCHVRFSNPPLTVPLVNGFGEMAAKRVITTKSTRPVAATVAGSHVPQDAAALFVEIVKEQVKNAGPNDSISAVIDKVGLLLETKVQHAIHHESPEDLLVAIGEILVLCLPAQGRRASSITEDHLKRLAAEVSKSQFSVIPRRYTTLAELIREHVARNSDFDSRHLYPVKIKGDASTKLITVLGGVSSDDVRVVEMLNNRYVAAPLRLVRMMTAMQSSAARGKNALVFYGSRGTGKTDLMITHGDPDLVVYIVPGSIRAEINDVEDLHQQAVSAADKATRSNLREQRNKACVDCVMAHVSELIHSVTGGTAAYDAKPSRTVRIVFDEMGAYLGMKRALIAEAGMLRAKLKAKFKADVEPIFIGGTGLAPASAADGSSISSYQAINLDEHRPELGDHLASFPQGLQQHYKKSKQTMEMSMFEALMSNMRMASIITACAHNWDPNKRSKHYGISFPSTAPPDGLWQDEKEFFAMVSREAINVFFLLSGFEKSQGDEITGALADAMAIDMGCYSSISATDHQRLVVKIGCLEDLHAEVEASDAVKRTNKAPSAVGVVGWGRYRVPAAYRALYLRLCLRLRSFPVGNDAALLEELAWQWLAVVAASVTVERGVSELLKIACAGEEPAALSDATFTQRLIRQGDVLRRDGDLDRTKGLVGQVACLRSEKCFPFPKNCSASTPLYMPHLHQMPTMRQRSDDYKPPSDGGDPAALVLLNSPGASWADVQATFYHTNAARTRFSTNVYVQLKNYPKTKFSLVNYTREMVKVGMCAEPDDDGASADIRARAVAREKKVFAERLFLVVLLGSKDNIANLHKPKDTKKGTPVTRGLELIVAVDKNGTPLPRRDGRPPFYPLFAGSCTTSSESETFHAKVDDAAPQTDKESKKPQL